MPYRSTITRANGAWTRIMVDNTISVNLATEVDPAYAQAYDRFYTKAFEQAQLALSLRESGKSMAMVAKRAGQLYRAVRALKSFRFGDFSRELGITALSSGPRKKMDEKWFKQSATKSLSDTWLEYTFGWKPLVDDIGSAVKVLQQDFKSRPVIGKSVRFTTNSQKNDSSEEQSVTKIDVRIRGTPVITNPNRLLAKQLGFTNPALVLWDAVPFSFVVDWFVPVSKFLTSYDNEVGYTVIGRSKSVRVSTDGLFRHAADGAAPGACYVHYFDRTIPSSFPQPDLSSRMRVPELSPWLAATSISLVVQQLSSLVSRK